MAATGAATTQEVGMRYLLLIYGDESRFAQMSEAETQADMGQWFEYDAAIKAAGASPGGEALQPTATATSVRDDNGDPLVTDGPFAETREQLAGYYMLDVENLDEAIKWAHRCPAAKGGTVELRPIQEFEQG
jgi:hypothetical protein